MELGLTGRVALVTGGNRGIGRGIADGLAAEGCALLLTGRDEAALGAAAAAVRARGGKVSTCALDLRAEAGAAELIAAVQREFGHLDILVNNAGATRRGDFLSLTDADWQDGFALKFFGHVRLARAAWPLLKQSQGSVVIIAGNGGRMPTADFTIGSSVNAACGAFGKALADIGKRDGIQVNTIHPGHVDTERMHRQLRARWPDTPLAQAIADYRAELDVTRLGVPQDIADLVAFIASPRARWLHGATITIDGGEIRVI